MKLPKSVKGRLKLLIAIAENGNPPLTGYEKLSDIEHHLIGSLIAGIQNNLGEMKDTLAKFDLEYRG